MTDRSSTIELPRPYDSADGSDSVEPHIASTPLEQSSEELIIPQQHHTVEPNFPATPDQPDIAEMERILANMEARGREESEERSDTYAAPVNSEAKPMHKVKNLLTGNGVVPKLIKLATAPYRIAWRLLKTIAKPFRRSAPKPH